MNRHVVRNRIGCLCVASERRIHFPAGSDLTLFFRNLVVPFLFGQHWYDLTGEWPDGDRQHGADGILQAYADLLDRHDRGFIERTLALLAQEQRPKGHTACPCGSGRRLRDCHGVLLWRLRDRIARADAAYDLWFLREKESGARGSAGK